MRRIRRFFRLGPSKSEWARIVNELTLGLAEVRRDWFKACIARLRGSIEPGDPDPVRHATLDGKGMHAVLAWQLLDMSVQLEARRYVPPWNGADFATLLYAQVCGTDLQKCLSYVEMLRREELSQRLTFVSLDVATCATGSRSFLTHPILVAQLLPHLTLLSRLALAYAFEDHPEVRRLESNLEALRNSVA